MGSGFLDDGHTVRLEKGMPCVHLPHLAQDKTDVIEPLRRLRLGAGGRTVQGQVIGPAGEIHVVRIRPPFHAHPEQLGVKPLAGLEVADFQRDMMQSGNRPRFLLESNSAVRIYGVAADT